MPDDLRFLHSIKKRNWHCILRPSINIADSKSRKIYIIYLIDSHIDSITCTRAYIF
jgi:hypothetical protein